MALKSTPHNTSLTLPAPGDLAEFCQRNHIRRLALFGSALGAEFGPDSDVDLLVEFEAGHEVGLITFAGMENRLSALVGRKVDLRTAEDLSRYFRQAVMDTAEALYER
jgi:hypothetical protein